MALTYAAALVGNVVKDVEGLDESMLSIVRPDGLERTECPDYVKPGWIKSGSDWLMPDGSVPPASVVRRFILPRELLGKLSDASLTAICTAAQTQPSVLAALFRLASSSYLASDDPLLLTAFAWLKNNAILTSSDKEELFMLWRSEPPTTQNP